MSEDGTITVMHRCHRCGEFSEDTRPWGKTRDEWICFDCWMNNDDVCARVMLDDEEADDDDA